MPEFHVAGGSAASYLISECNGHSLYPGESVGGGDYFSRPTGCCGLSDWSEAIGEEKDPRNFGFSVSVVLESGAVLSNSSIKLKELVII